MNTLYHKNYAMLIHPAAANFFFSLTLGKDGRFIRNTEEITRRREAEHHPALADIPTDDGENLNSKMCLSYIGCPLYSVSEGGKFRSTSRPMHVSSASKLPYSDTR
jgi:hypothetical protein